MKKEDDFIAETDVENLAYLLTILVAAVAPQTDKGASYELLYALAAQLLSGEPTADSEVEECGAKVRQTCFATSSRKTH